MNVPRLFENEARIAELGVGIGFGTILRTIEIATILTVLFLTWPVLGEQFGVSRRASSTPPSPPQYYVAPTLSPLSGVAAVSTKTSPQSGSQVVPAAESASPMPNVVRLNAFDQSGQSFGSGSYIGNFDEYGLVLSNWHVVCETDGLVHIHFPCGFSSYGAMILSDNKWDLAMIVVSKPPSSVPPLPIARTMPKPGDPLWIAGHGSGSYRQAGGRCVRYLAPEIPRNGTAPLYEIIDLSVHARQGDSGGPILNRDGELAGVLFGSDMVKNTAGSCCERVNRFLHQARPLLENLPRRPEVHFAQTEPQGPRHPLIDSLSNPARTKETFSVPNAAGLESSPPTSFQVPDPFVPPQSGVAPDLAATGVHH